jgi:hypothetical protein
MFNKIKELEEYIIQCEKNLKEIKILFNSSIHHTYDSSKFPTDNDLSKS